MARLPRLFQTRSLVPREKSNSCRFGLIKGDSLDILKMVYHVYSLESPLLGDANENTQHTFILK